MAQQETQPEEALTRSAAGAAQFAGNFTQTSMYGKAMAGRNNPGGQQRTEPSTRPAAEQPEPDAASTPTAQDDPALRELIGRFDPVEEAMWRAEQPPGEEWGPEPPPPVIEPGTWTFAQASPAEDTPTTTADQEPPAPDASEDEHEILLVEEDDPFLLGTDLDSAAAQHRLQLGQVEPPPTALPPGPALGPGPV